MLMTIATHLKMTPSPAAQDIHSCVEIDGLWQNQCMKHGFRSAFVAAVCFLNQYCCASGRHECFLFSSTWQHSQIQRRSCLPGNGQRWLRLSLHLDRAEELGGMWDMGSVERSIEMRWHLQARPKSWKSFGGKSIADESDPGPITYQRMTFEIVQHLWSKSWTRVRIEISTAPIDRHRGPSWICVPDQLSLCSHHASEVCEEAQREHFKGFAGLAWRGNAHTQGEAGEQYHTNATQKKANKWEEKDRGGENWRR